MNAGRLRLLHLREQVEAVGAEMIDSAPRFRALADDRRKPRAASSFNLFQTPEPLAARMAAMLPALPADAEILEPSAGLGRLYHAVRAAGYTQPITLVDNAPDCCRELYVATRGDPRATLVQRDFMEVGGAFDAVVMNPPFKMGHDVRHIMHARSLLKPGGVLIALCYDGAKQAAKLEPIADTWEPLGPGLFDGTRAAVVLLTMGGAL